MLRHGEKTWENRVHDSKGLRRLLNSKRPRAYWHQAHIYETCLFAVFTHGNVLNVHTETHSTHTPLPLVPTHTSPHKPMQTQTNKPTTHWECQRRLLQGCSHAVSVTFVCGLKLAHTNSHAKHNTTQHNDNTDNSATDNRQHKERDNARHTRQRNESRQDKCIYKHKYAYINKYLYQYLYLYTYIQIHEAQSERTFPDITG